MAGTTANLCINTTFDKNLQNYCKDFVIGIRLHLTRLAVILEPVNVQFCAFYLFDAILLKIKGEFDYDLVVISWLWLVPLPLPLL